MHLEKYEEMIKKYNNDKDMINKYPEIFDNRININFKVYISTNLDSNKEIDLKYTYKFNIESNYLNHNLELFSINNDDFFGIVAQFHLPCVRAYYDGINVFLTPSCISAHLTYMNIDYKYFAGSKDPLDIINKNRLRGFGTWLNKNEIIIMKKYCNSVLFWTNLYSLSNNNNNDNNNTDNNILGPLSLNHKIFRPRLYNIDYFLNKNLNLNNRYDNSELGFTVYHTTKSVPLNIINYDNFISIDENGNIIPVKKWIILTSWDLIYNI